jgi:pSer/pThr/pTyr-binding forkhead associated (FHA) protein/thioredoxin reductase/NAD-dependent dihydropyrimidine dehydrogenase PreA subunit
MIRLIFHTGPRAGTEVATAAAAIKIGRNPEWADLVVTDPSVSGKHARLERSPQGTYLIEDVGSTHGTTVNGQRLAPGTKAVLNPGDRFLLGESQVEVGEGRPRLMVVQGKLSGVEIPLGLEPVTVGAARDNRLALPGPGVDQYHALILCLPTGFAVQDNHAGGVTLVNGQKVDRYLLADGDIITVGENEVRFLIQADAGVQHQAVEAAQQASATGEQTTIRGLLYFVSGPHEYLEVPLGDAPVILGRRGDCTVVLSDPHASGQHCQLVWNGTGYQLSEIKATYGTYVNGQRLTAPVVLTAGDTISLGSSVIEFRVLGGQAQAGATVIAEGAYAVVSRPKFIIGGSVVARDQITIGRAAGNDIFLEEDDVSRVHCEIKWDGKGFVVTDKSKGGTYIGSRRVVSEMLQTGHVLRVGANLWSVDVRGERLTLEKIDADTALAALEVARETQFSARQVQPGPGAAAAAAGGEGGAHKTMFRVNVSNVDGMVAERKARHAKKKGAPMWRPTTDIEKRRRGLVAVAASSAAAIAVCVWFFVGSSSQAALTNHPLSQAHTSKAFTAAAAEHGAGSVSCAACHKRGAGAPESKCLACHAGFEPRDKHLATHVAKTPGRTPPGACSACHREHRSAPRGELLGAQATCATATCHPNQHAERLSVAKSDAPVVLKAKALESCPSQDKLHLIHQNIEGRCVGCHGSKDEKPVDPGLSCFRCHDGGAKLATSQCLCCHGFEHPKDVARLGPAPELAVATSVPPTPARSAGTAGALTLAVLSPLFFMALVLRLRSRRRAEEIVSKLQEIPAESFKRLVHSINRDKCVGCSMCVTSCPASVLELVEHKSTVVNFDACIQCRKCEQACNFDALRMHDADKPPPMVEMPDVDAHNETPVPGLYLIGQAAGNPQIKNAANVGHKVAAAIARSLRPGQCRELGAQVDVLVVGAGPGGIACGIACAELGLWYGVIEKNATFAATQQNYYFKGKHVMAEPSDVKNISRLPVFDGDRESILAGWAQAIQQSNLQVRYGENVTEVKKEGEVFVVKATNAAGAPVAEYRALRVVLAIGTMANPRKLGCPGDHLPKVKNALVDPDEFKGKNVLVVGGGDAGIEVALSLGPTNKVWLSVRGAGPDRIKPGNKKKLDEAIAAGIVQTRFSTQMAEVADGKVVVKHGDGRLEELPNDVVFAMVGGIPPVKWLQGLGVPYVNKPHSWSPPRSDHQAGEISAK